MRTTDYTTFLSREAALIGVGIDDLQADERAILNAHFNGAIKEGWERMNWAPLCPYGEARAMDNLITYPTRFARAASWTLGNITATDEAFSNPADGAVTATKLRETAATSVHYASQTVQGLRVATSYAVSCFLRSVNRTYGWLSAQNSTESCVVYVNLLTGEVDSATGSGWTNISASVSQAANGFWYVQLLFTTNSTLGSASTVIGVGMSDTASAATYLGVVTSGVDVWLPTCLPTSNTGPQDATVSLTQTGFDEIESVFDAWWSFPRGPMPPPSARYQFTTDGIQFISPASGLPYPFFLTPSVTIQTTVVPSIAFLSYRKQVPDYTGVTFDATATYAVGDQIYFEDSDDVGNYWECIVATTAGQDPEDTPASWELLEIPAFLLEFIVYRVFADWLRTEGQFAKAVVMSQAAENAILNEADKQERQQNNPQLPKVYSHLAAQFR